MENDVVTDIVGYLNDVYEITTDNHIHELRVVAARLTAAEIGFARQGSAMGNVLTSWSGRLEDVAWRTLQRYYISQSLNLTKKSVSYVQRLFNSKMRSKSLPIQTG